MLKFLVMSRKQLWMRRKRKLLGDIHTSCVSHRRCEFVITHTLVVHVDKVLLVGFLVHATAFAFGYLVTGYWFYFQFPSAWEFECWQQGAFGTFIGAIWSHLLCLPWLWCPLLYTYNVKFFIIHTSEYEYMVFTEDKGEVCLNFLVEFCCGIYIRKRSPNESGSS